MSLKDPSIYGQAIARGQSDKCIAAMTWKKSLLMKNEARTLVHKDVAANALTAKFL